MPYRLIIVDDERLIREGLVTYIDWASLNIEISAVCANGQEGVRAIEQYAPDMVLTDISMPLMDGVALLRHTREQDLTCEFIFISSYAEFRYAQEAVKYGAFDYLLKPIEPDALLQCVKRCAEKVESRRMRHSEPGLSRSVIEEWLRNVLTNAPSAELALLDMLRQQGITPSQLWLMAILTAKPLKEAEGCYAAVLSERVTAVLCSNEQTMASLISANSILKENSRALSASKQMTERFSEAAYQLWLEQLPPSDRLEAGKSDDTPPSRAVVSALHQAGMLTALRRALQTYCREEKNRLTAVRDRAQAYLSDMYRQLEEHHQSPLPNLPTSEHRSGTLSACNNLFDLLTVCEEIAKTLYAAQLSCPAYTLHTRRAIRLLRQEYGGNLTLHGVAARLNVSPSYFSTLFKADTGYAFSDYLYRYRMNIARSLLQGGQHKIYEIGEQVGYTDVVQFSKRFKQFYGMSPRQMLRSMENVRLLNSGQPEDEPKA